MLDLIVVGGGMAGCIAARVAQQRGMKVLVLDDDRPFSGTKAAAGLFKPSWFSLFNKEQYAGAVELLSGITQVKKIPFETAVSTVQVGWVNLARLLYGTGIDRKLHRVTRVRSDAVDLANGGTYRAKHVVVANGAWLRELLPSLPPVDPLVGVSLRYRGVFTEPRLKLYRPYKQAIVFQISEGVTWFGDGSTYNREKFSAANVEDTRKRAKALFGLPPPRALVTVGWRPKLKTHPAGLLECVDGVWALNGGGKNGALLYAHLVHQLMEKL